MRENTKVKLALIGAGGRGKGLAQYALDYPNEVEFVAVADPSDSARESFAKAHNINSDMAFKSWEELLAVPKLADGLFICTQDTMHFEPTLKAMEQGYKYILLEKPISPSLEECNILARVAKERDVNIQVCHSLRYTNFYRQLKKFIDDGAVGEVININHTEGVWHMHYAHSFIRGPWRNTKESSPMILAKCCHDTDLLLYLTGRNCKSISSFGSLTHFKEENAPEGSTDRCINNCKARSTCPYDAVNFYRTDELWGNSLIHRWGEFTSVTDVLQNGDHGRCVYRLNNDVVDHQVLNVLFDNDATATLTMCAYENGRTTYISGPMGKIYASFEDHLIVVEDFLTGHKATYDISQPRTGHHGADTNVVRDFVAMIADNTEGYTDIQISVQSHAMCHAAEISRHEKRIVDLDELKSL